MRRRRCDRWVLGEEVARGIREPEGQRRSRKSAAGRAGRVVAGCRWRSCARVCMRHHGTRGQSVPNARAAQLDRAIDTAGRALVESAPPPRESTEASDLLADRHGRLVVLLPLPPIAGVASRSLSACVGARLLGCWWSRRAATGDDVQRRTPTDDRGESDQRRIKCRVRTESAGGEAKEDATRPLVGRPSGGTRHNTGGKTQTTARWT